MEKDEVSRWDLFRLCKRIYLSRRRHLSLLRPNASKVTSYSIPLLRTRCFLFGIRELLTSSLSVTKLTLPVATVKSPSVNAWVTTLSSSNNQVLLPYNQLQALLLRRVGPQLPPTPTAINPTFFRAVTPFQTRTWHMILLCLLLLALLAQPVNISTTPPPSILRWKLPLLRQRLPTFSFSQQNQVCNLTSAKTS